MLLPGAAEGGEFGKKERKITMENYISINGEKIGLTEKQVERIKGSLDIWKVKLADTAPGDIVKVGKHEFIVLEHREEGTAMIRKELLQENVVFGSNNNYAGSHVEVICIEFATELAAIVGEDNLILHTVDLTSDDGLKDYGTVRRKASLLTADMYRRFVQILDKHKLDAWWWLATPYSTPAHENDHWVKCVSPSGRIRNGNCISDVNCGVRPFCILKSNIFVSKRKEKQS